MRPPKKRGSANISRLSKANSLRDLAIMEEKLGKRYGDNYTTEVNKFWKGYYKDKYNEKEKNTPASL
jgi:hypothetical protein